MNAVGQLLTTLRHAVRRYRLQFISFVTGFGLLTFELAAARVLAPNIGSSTYVWTGVIGVIIAALSMGFLVGGKIADKRNRATDLVWLLIVASMLATVTLISYEGIIQAIVDSLDDSRLQAVFAALILFAPTSFFIGMTSPYLAKLNVTSLKSTGQAIASLDMFNAIGGITGTFVTGFILFGYIGSYEAIGFVAVLLLLVSWLIAPNVYRGRRLIVTAVVLLTALTPATAIPGIVKIETASSHYQVIQSGRNGRPITGLITGPSGTQSAIYTNGTGEPVFWYANEMSRQVVARQPESILVLGGGAFTLPQYLSQVLPEATIDVVEIDPELLPISREYFGYQDPANVNEVFMDARAFINQPGKQYDVVLVDVYGDTSIPFSFMTKEYGAALARRVKPDGIVLANVIGGLKGKCYETLRAVDGAYRPSFGFVSFLKDPSRTDDRSNIIMAYSQQATTLEGFARFTPEPQRPYTDNYAPSERLYYECQEAVRI